jgi:hypothetical protein
MKSFKETLKILENSEEFKEWKKQNKNTFLSYGFLMLRENQADNWKIGYYHKQGNKITSFIVNKNIEIEPESEVFKKETTKVNKIDLEKLKIEVDKALETAKSFQKEKYSADNPNKTIIILQKIKIGQVWNITLLTSSLKVINIKISTENNKILEHKASSMFEFKK